MSRKKFFLLSLTLLIVGCAQLNGDPYLLFAPPKQAESDEQNTQLVDIMVSQKLGIEQQIDIQQQTLNNLQKILDKSDNPSDLQLNEKQQEEVALGNLTARLEGVKTELLAAQEQVFIQHHVGLQKPWSSVRLSSAEQKIAKGDVFSLYLDRAYFRYLPDFGNNAEVVAIFEFDEGLGEDKVVTKVIGPHNNIADASYSPFFNRLVYGPKKLEGNKLGIKVTLLEFDGAENEKAASVIDLIGEAQKTLNIADPVTTAEKEAAKVIAKTLLAFNGDDDVFNFTQDFTTDSQVSPDAMMLSTGHWVAVKREICPMLRCHGYFWRSAGAGGVRNLPAKVLAGITEVVLALPIAVMRVFTDTPDYPAWRKLGVTDDSAYPVDTGYWHNTDTHKLIFSYDDRAPVIYNRTKTQKVISDFESGENKPAPRPRKFVAAPATEKTLPDNINTLSEYREKTWLSFSFYKGGDASTWETLKALSQADQTLLTMIQQAKNQTINQQSYLPAFAQLQTQVQDAGNWLTLAGPANKTFTQADDAIEPTFLLTQSRAMSAATVRLLNINKTAYQHNNVAVVQHVDLAAANSRVFSVKLLDKAILAAGEYLVEVTLNDANMKSQVHRYTLTVK